MSDNECDTTEKVKVTPELLKGIENELCSDESSIACKTRAIFTLRNLGGDGAVNTLIQGMKDRSPLLRHEICFALGQMQEESAIDFLLKVLSDNKENSMVRHEAGEALGAIGDHRDDILKALETHAKDELPEVAETCQLALARLQWYKEKDAATKKAQSKFVSVDPAPPAPADTPVEQLAAMLRDSSRSMFERYGAMFSLRDLGTTEAIAALHAGFVEGDSALLKHELAYVLGQLQLKDSSETLIRVLQNRQEHDMVRHEAAEALGAIGGDHEVTVLKQYLNDKQESSVVRESCAVALDMADYFCSAEFEYADGFEKHHAGKSE